MSIAGSYLGVGLRVKKLVRRDGMPSAREQLVIDGEAEALNRKAVELALDGDPAALRLCIERIPPCRERTVSFTLPQIESAADVFAAMNGHLGARQRHDYAGRGGADRDRDLRPGRSIQPKGERSL